MGDDRLATLKGALDVLILEALRWGPMHGYGVSPWCWSGRQERWRPDAAGRRPPEPEW